MQKNFKRVLAVALSTVMAASAFSISAAAYNKDYQSETHTVFKHTEQTLAPGVEYYNNYAYLKDGEQVVYYAAVADINRDDVIVQGSYWNSQIEQYGMAKLTEQVASANAKFSNPDDPDFISENYTVVAGTNGDFYNMQTGRPSGAFAINGHVMNESNNRPWFAIFEDNTALCGSGSADYAAAIEAHGKVMNSVGGSQMLVQDGKDVTASASGSYNTDRHSRTMIGVTADNKVVSIVVDGRQSPFSDGGSMHELAQIMLEAECVTAINLDGGGSTTFGARPEGEDSFKVINRPSDGSERSISSGVIIASLAKSSNVFDHISMSVADEYVTPGTSTKISVAGVSSSGSAAEIPAEVTYQVSNGSFDGETFTAGNAAEDAVVTAMYNGNAVGTATVHVVIPDSIEFSQATFTIPYGKTVDLGITAKYGLNKVVTKPADFNYNLEIAEGAGIIENGAIVAPEEGSEATANTVTAKLVLDETKTATSNIVYGKASKVLFDFEDGTTQKWVRYNTANYNYIHTRGSTSNVTAENGKVHSGEHALKVEAKFSETWEAGYVSGRAGVSGMDEVIDLKGATRIGMWVYLPVENKSFNGRMFMCKVTERDEETGAITKYEGYYTDTKIDKGGDWNCGFITQYDEPGWHYIYFDLSTDTDWCLIKNHALLDFYINDRNGDSYGYNHLDYTNQNSDLIFYIDDVTVDYSSVVEDRERPVFSQVLLGDDGPHSNEGLVLARGSNYESDGYNRIDLSARVADDTTKTNYTGLNASTAKVYIDGIEFPCTYANGIITAPTYTFTNGQHTVKFSIEDNAGNLASAIRTFTVTNTSNDQPVWIEAKNPDADKILLGSLYWVNVKAADAANVSTVTMDLDLDNLSNWELDHMEVAQGFDAEYKIVNADENIAKLTITRNSDDIALLDGDAIVSMPIRTWELPAVAANYGHAGVVWMYDKYKKGNEVWPVNVILNVAAGQASFADNSTEIFTGDEINVRTESIYWDNDNAKASDPYYTSWNGGHDHRPETAQYYAEGTTNHVDAVAVPDLAPTCTEDGYTGRTYCETCNSIVNWGTVVPATGHTYEVIDGVLKCTNCDELFNGTYTDGKLYADGIPVNGDVDGILYEDGVPYNGYKEIDGVYRNFEDGVDKGTYSGLVEKDGDIYYAKFGVFSSGWRIDENDNYYYFSPVDNKAVDGVVTIDGKTYTFVDKKLYDGHWEITDKGVRLYWAGEMVTTRWFQIRDDRYFFYPTGYAATGLQVVNVTSNGEKGAFVFGDDGKLIERLTGNGLVFYGNDAAFLENDVAVHAGLVRSEAGDFYYIDNTLKAVRNVTRNISEGRTNGLLPSGEYTFGDDGKMVIDIKQGIVEEDGELYYYVDGQKTAAYLVNVDGKYYFFGSSLFATRNTTRFISEEKTNGLLPEGYYTFGDDGAIVFAKEGIVEEDGELYYYVDGEKTAAGVVKVNGKYYFFGSSLYASRDMTRFISASKTNGLIEEGYYTIDSNGVIIVPENDGIVEIDGELYYFENGEKTIKNLVEVDGKYYFFGSSLYATRSRTRFISEAKTNGLLPEGYYTFGDDGAIII